MNKFKLILFSLIIGGVIVMIPITMRSPEQAPFSYSLRGLFQELGKPFKSIDRAVSCVLPVSELDEKLLGDEIKATLSQTSIHENNITVEYLNDLVQFLCQETQKPFKYRIFLIEGPPNACALPGGVICLTSGLIDLIENEAELVSIIAHEVGHIERGHLFDAVRGELLRRKLGGSSYSFYAFELLHSTLSLAFSKAQEDEADEYSFRLLAKKRYDLFAMASAFEKLESMAEHENLDNVLFDDFFATHPHTKLRREKFWSLAKLWTARNNGEMWYRGKQNFENRVTLFSRAYADEWVHI